MSKRYVGFQGCKYHWVYCWVYLFWRTRNPKDYEFFETRRDAEAAGYEPCWWCRDK